MSTVIARECVSAFVCEKEGMKKKERTLFGTLGGETVVLACKEVARYATTRFLKFILVFHRPHTYVDCEIGQLLSAENREHDENSAAPAYCYPSQYCKFKYHTSLPYTSILYIRSSVYRLVFSFLMYCTVAIVMSEMVNVIFHDSNQSKSHLCFF